VIAAALGLSHASAGSIYFTGSGTGNIVYSSWSLTSTFFGFFDAYFDTSIVCPSCFSASTPGGTPLGNFGLSIGGNYFVSNTGNGLTAMLVGTSLYYELLVPFGGGTGSIGMSNANLVGPYLLNGALTGIGIYGTVTSTSATIEYDITNATSQVIGSLPSTLYLDISGTTTTPISITTYATNPQATVINPFNLDWTATLSDTSLLNTSTSGVPEPSTLLLILGGAVCLAARKQR
jgi:PEP-CTERM motif